MIVRYADWEFCCLLPMSGSQSGGGLQIVFAVYRGQAVLERGSQPFTIVSYHDSSGPFFKDGLGSDGEGLVADGGGVPYMPLRPDAPNVGSWAQSSGAFATSEADAIVVEEEPATVISPASVAVWAKFQVGNYQYIHRWEFRADGVIEPGVGLGGPLYGSQPGIIEKDPARSERLRALSHIHNFYFRLDFQIGRGGNQVIERQQHSHGFDFLSPSDEWEPITHEFKDTFNGSEYTRWRIRHRFQKNANGQPVSYEIVPGSLDPPDLFFSTADFFVHRRSGFSEQLGSEVGINDAHIMNGYATPGILGLPSPLDTDDTIIWHVLREHHRTASLGEERLTLPYHFQHFTIRPRDFLDNTPLELYATNPPSPLPPP